MLAHWGVINTFVALFFEDLLNYIKSCSTVGVRAITVATRSPITDSPVCLRLTVYFLPFVINKVVTNGTLRLFNMTMLSVNAWKARSLRQNRSKWHVATMYETFHSVCREHVCLSAGLKSWARSVWRAYTYWRTLTPRAGQSPSAARRRGRSTMSSQSAASQIIDNYMCSFWKVAASQENSSGTNKQPQI